MPSQRVTKEGVVVEIDLSGSLPWAGVLGAGAAHADFVRHQEARLLALWLGPPTTAPGPDGTFAHTWRPAEDDRRRRDEECQGLG